MFTQEGDRMGGMGGMGGMGRMGIVGIVGILGIMGLLDLRLLSGWSVSESGDGFWGK